MAPSNDLFVLRLTRMEIIWLQVTLQRVITEAPTTFTKEELSAIQDVNRALLKIASENSMPLVAEHVPEWFTRGEF